MRETLQLGTGLPSGRFLDNGVWKDAEAASSGIHGRRSCIGQLSGLSSVGREGLSVRWELSPQVIILLDEEGVS